MQINYIENCIKKPNIISERRSCHHTSKDWNMKKFTFNDFMKILRDEVIPIILDKKNYTCSFKCQFCNRKIEPRSYPDHFHLFTDTTRRYFITFHFNCALKEGTSEQLNEIIQTFDYITDFSEQGE